MIDEAGCPKVLAVSPHPTAAHVASRQPGYFVLSFDTELAWGYFDKEEMRRELFSPDGSRERAAIRKLLALCDEFQVPATWAIVGHLAMSHDRCGEDCPVHSWRGRYSSYDEIRGGRHPLWYGRDVVETLVAAEDRHEIAFHGFSHRPFDEASMGRHEADTEIRLWLSAFADLGPTPRSVVFPRNVVGHLDVLQDHGFVAYRSVCPEPYGSGVMRLAAKYADQLLGFTVPPAHVIAPGYSPAMVDVPASVEMFGFNRQLERRLDTNGLHRLRMRRVVRAVRRAGRTGGTVHLWAHPWEFRDDKDFDKLRFVLEVVAAERDAGRLETMTMAQRAELALAEAEHPLSHPA